MNFFIRKNSTLPILKMKLVQDGRNDFRHFWRMMENSTITFSMKNSKNGVYKVANEAGFLIAAPSINGNADQGYFIGYQFNTEDTNETGVFMGEFNITFLDMENNNSEIGDLKVPIREDLYIHILDSFTFSEVI